MHSERLGRADSRWSSLMDSIVTVATAIVDALTPWPTIFAFDVGRYVLIAGAVAVIVSLLPAATLIRRVVQKRSRATSQPFNEFWRSIRAAFVFSLVGTVVYFGAGAGVLRIYPAVSEHGWFYWVWSLVLIIVAHDGYFYWTHRWMHRPQVFRSLHRTHHRSIAPTAWAAYSFSIGEAAVQALFLPLFLLVVPMHPLALFLWMAHQIIRNALGHCGVELVPRTWLASWWGRWLTTTLHHDLHHSGGRYNYGLYFTWWDRRCGTEHPEYRERLSRLVEGLQRYRRSYPVPFKGSSMRVIGREDFIAMKAFVKPKEFWRTSSKRRWVRRNSLRPALFPSTIMLDSEAGFSSAINGGTLVATAGDASIRKGSVSEIRKLLMFRTPLSGHWDLPICTRRHEK
jgi:Delta7-sterol 5-desaturase